MERSERLITATNEGDLAAVRSILDRSPALVNVANSDGFFALDRASKNGHLALTQILIDNHGANISRAPHPSMWPASRAICRSCNCS